MALVTLTALDGADRPGRAIPRVVTAEEIGEVPDPRGSWR